MIDEVRREAKRAYNHQYYEANREKLKARQRVYNAANGAQRAITDRAYYAANQDRIVQQARTKRLRQYGLTLDQYDVLLEFQGGGCMICGRRTPDRGHSRFVVDHDHNCCPGTRSCGQCLRGLLCTSCNTGSGVLDWDDERIAAMLRYRSDPPWSRMVAVLTGGEM